MSALCQYLHIPYQLKRSSRRRSLALQIGPAGLTVLAPQQLALQHIESFIAKKQLWVEKHLLQLQQQPRINHLAVGQLPLLDQMFELKVVEDVHSAVTMQQQQLWVQISGRVKAANRAKYIYKLVQSWYQQQANQWFSERILYWQQHMQVQAGQLQIKNWQHKWGSCHQNGTISLNWRLMLAPAWVADYVVVHELAHLRFMDHSAQFWQLVLQHYPQANAVKNWLKQHQQQLHLLEPGAEC